MDRLRTPAKRLVTLFLVSLMVWGVAGGAMVVPSQAEPTSRVHPFLAATAARGPEEWVDVIVAMQPGAAESAVVKESGGKRLRSWPFINAVQIHLPAHAASTLAGAPGVAYVAPDSPIQANTAFDQMATAAHYHAALGVQNYWSDNYDGAGIGVAVIDSGVAGHSDLAGRVVKITLPAVGAWQDAYGHGTHLAGIIAGNNSDNSHIGVAPGATIYNLRVTDSQGATTEGTVISALEWVYNNHATYNIRVVNLSLQSSVATSYTLSPLAGAVERLWFDGVVVVASSGNRGSSLSAAMYPPANDPYIITVGAMDDRGTKAWGDDDLVSWSSQGLTAEANAKPDVLAPGRLILGPLATGSVLRAQFPSRVSGQYISLSGTSMAAPVISGTVALILHRNPTLTPDQVKYALMNYSRPALPGQLLGGPRVPDVAALFAGVGANPAGVPAWGSGLVPSLFAVSGGTDGASNVYYENVYYETIYTDQSFLGL